MAKIEDLQQIDLKAIEKDALKDAIKDINDAYKIAEDKAEFIKEETANINKLFGFVEKLYPEAIVEKEEPKKENSPKKSTKKPNVSKGLVEGVIDDLRHFGAGLTDEDQEILEPPTDLLEVAVEAGYDEDKFIAEVRGVAKGFGSVFSKISSGDTEAKQEAIEAVNKLLKELDEPLLDAKGKSKKATTPTKKEAPAPKKLSKEDKEKALKELEEFDSELARCRATIKEYNKQKKEAEGEKPKKTRLDKIDNHFKAIANLIPDNRKENLDAQKKTEKALLQGRRSILSAFGMDKLKKVKAGEEAIKEKFDEIEEKIEQKTDKT